MADTTDSIREYIFSSLREMNYDTDGIDNDSELGPRGADLASLALVELALRVEEEYGVKFSEEEAEELAAKTVGEFCAIVAERLPAAGTTVE
ncbi:MAG: hypothetical protein JWM19_3419 [Actinomycetia bacterium]|nr:hypothetical protein [Actinomycetes bacterium]